MAHVIRLRGPWEFEVRSGNSGTTGIIQVPCDLAEALGAECHGVVRLSRRFNRPSGLNRGTLVWLILEDDHEFMSVWLNDQRLDLKRSERGSTRFELTNRLEAHNWLRVEAQVEDNPPGRFQGARIEIDAPASE